MLVLRVPGRRALIIHTSDGPIRVINVGRNARRIGIAAPDHVRVTREPLHPNEVVAEPNEVVAELAEVLRQTM